MKTILLRAFVPGLAVLCSSGCQTTRLASHEYAPATGSRPAIVYVLDFELRSESVKHEDGVLPSTGFGAVDRVGQRLSGASKDPATRAREVVDLMSDSIVKRLSNSGLIATRLAPSSPLPSQGWLMRGIFLEVQEGNRLRRAIIGFGQGATDIQVVTSVHDLSQGAPKPLYEVAASAASGSGPGAAPTLVLGPYGAAARFVMAGSDLEKNVKQAAAEIADQTVQRINQATPVL